MVSSRSVENCLFYLTLPSGVPIDVAGHEPPSLSVLGSALGLPEGEAGPFGDVVTQSILAL